jgi:hypothetical protein
VLPQVWDIRMPQRELAALFGHGYAVRRVLFSPHAETVLASCSYDMTVRLWDFAVPEDAQLRVWDHHTEFAVGNGYVLLYLDSVRVWGCDYRDCGAGGCAAAGVGPPLSLRWVLVYIRPLDIGRWLGSL